MHGPHELAIPPPSLARLVGKLRQDRLRVDGAPRLQTEVAAVAAPAVVGRIGDELGADGIKVNIADEFQEVGVARALSCVTCF